jgi:sensor histidine kinase YesM
MHKRSVYKLAKTAGWVVLSSIALGAIPGLIEVVFQGIGLREFGMWTLHGSIYSFCIGVPCWALIPRAACALESRPAWMRIAILVALLGSFAMAGSLAASLILLAIHHLDATQFAGDFWLSLRIAFLMTFTTGLVSTVIATLQSRLSEARDELHRRQIADERERKIAAEARFASLESRVHPHFLFNTLNSIAALVREDPAQAERTIERLAALLRFSLDSEVAGVVKLAEELRIVRDYMEIEKVRFGDRLRYRIEAEPPAEEQTVPALSIQTLAENSVKYAVGARREGAEIVIRAHLRHGRLRIEVSDDGPGFEPSASLKPGHGLDLVQRRLAALFGSSACLEMSAHGGRMLVAISVAA